MGMFCPNCSAALDDKAIECWNCSAAFGEGSNWTPTDRPTGTFQEWKRPPQADLREVDSAPSLPNNNRSSASGCIPAVVGLFCLIVLVCTTGFGIGPDRGEVARFGLLLIFFVMFAGLCMKFATWGVESGIAAVKATAFSFYLPSFLYSMLGTLSLPKWAAIFLGPLSVLVNFWLVRVVSRRLKKDEPEV